MAAAGICLDARPVVLVAALRPLQDPLPTGLRGSVLLRGMDAYLRELSRLERRLTSAVLPGWTEEGGTPKPPPGLSPMANDVRSGEEKP